MYIFLTKEDNINVPLYILLCFHEYLVLQDYFILKTYLRLQGIAGETYGACVRPSVVNFWLPNDSSFICHSIELKPGI